jgi:putative flippase GtrA
MSARVGPFIVVGALGFAIQLAALTILTESGCPVVTAAAVAVEIAIVHNFCWHECWTWRDRGSDSHWTAKLARFHATTGVASMTANVILTSALVEFGRLQPVIANSVAVALMSAVNFVIADRWVFARQTSVIVVLGAAGTLAPLAANAAPPVGTLEAWRVYVARAETQMDRPATTACPLETRPQGESLGVAGGTIHHWHGCTFIPGASVEAIVDGLMHPGTPPPQEDILESRVLSRQGDSLRVYLRIVRRTILTVTYDTEHDVTFARPRPGFATSRSVATRIVESRASKESNAAVAESSAGDRGFLWKLNSYWRYIQTNGGVRIELESLSLSRDVPMLLRPVASPIIARVARESIARALDAVRTRFAPARQSD